MTLNEMTAALNAHHNQTFGDNYAGHFGISIDEAERIAAKSSSVEDFYKIWMCEDWWTDENA